VLGPVVSAASEAGAGLTDEELYLFDTMGFLKVAPQGRLLRVTLTPPCIIIAFVILYTKYTGGVGIALTSTPIK
jgi:hypothetical protein